MVSVERRQTFRTEAEIKITYRTEKKATRGYIGNLSTGGLFILADPPLDVGEQIEVTFFLPKSEVIINARAEICWKRESDPNDETVKAGMGVKFIPKKPIEKEVHNRPSEFISQEKIEEADRLRAISKKEKQLSAMSTPEPKRAPESSMLGADLNDMEEKSSALDIDAMIESKIDGLLSKGTKEIPENEARDTKPLQQDDSTAAIIETPAEKVDTSTEIYEAPIVDDETPMEDDQELPVEEAKPEAAAATATATATENRIAPRFDLEVQIDMETDANFFIGYTTNISSGGLFIATYDPLARGEFIKVTFSLPHRVKPFELLGEVCWSREYNEMHEGVTPGMGINFVDLSEEDKTSINYFIDKIREPIFHPEEEEEA